ncbi:PREDICTED: uncharacterized protein LOC109341584 [Lupinus angustifolius]|uniref:uncharacterized protein LOC109341584 n=1 Tax=Lupinus angustifolius TaxID=3871 RepID=UPI00092EFE76|nr:PREDICTED: uncharacterized protein LOC109341584 [Lupinus angustifolius]
MTPFLFLMVAEGSIGLVGKARSNGALEDYKIGGDGVEVCDLQFVDDTIIVCKPSHKNLFCLKTILRCFELASVMKVNSNKSSRFGIRLSDSTISAVINFLFCKIDSLPFTYLDIPIRANPRRISTWQYMIVVVSKRLASWKCKHISFGGRLILLNYVLSNISTYMLSLYKAPKNILTKIVSLHRNFLLGNKRGGKCISWVAWDVVCNPMELGGLGVKDLLCFNNALNDLASRWWKDLQKVGSSNWVTGGWFDENVWKEIGTGLQTLF